MTISLSKSRFLSGSQCEKRLYYDIFRKELKPPVSEAQQQLFSTGHQVGRLAQNRFASGIDVSPADIKDFGGWLSNTQKALENGVQTIYEAAFAENGMFVALDILHNNNGERLAIEVKSSASVKDYHLLDCAFQYMVMERVGVRPDRFILLHIDSDYVLQGAIDEHKLLKESDITDQILALQPIIAERMVELQKMLHTGSEPDRDIGPHCESPFACEYKHHCWKHVPEKNIFDLPRFNKQKAWDLYEQGIIDIHDLPEDFALTENQQRSVNSLRTGEPHINHEAISGFLDSLVYPLSFFDFETIGSTIPMLQGTSPFQQIPFQYSMHIVRQAGAPLEHREFLGDESHYRFGSAVDPLEQLIISMRTHFPESGTILAYNMGFEKGVLSMLEKMYPHHAEYLTSLKLRFKDLLDVFSKGWYHLPGMYSSASIKVVLPLLAPEMDYENLEVGNGMEASNGFQRLIDGSLQGDMQLFKQNLLAYCKQDTEGMVVIWEKLKELVR